MVDVPTVVRLCVPEMTRPYSIFMLDNGATVNIVKIDALKVDIIINYKNALNIRGCTPGSVRTVGTTTLNILGSP